MSRQVIHPSVWSEPKLARLPLELHLAYVYLLPLADHWGRFEWDTLKIWRDVGEPRGLSQARLEKWLLGLWDQGIIGRYAVDGRQLAWFTVYEGLSEGRRYRAKGGLPEPTQETVVARNGSELSGSGNLAQKRPEAPETPRPAKTPAEPVEPPKQPQSWLQEALGLSGGLPVGEIAREFDWISQATNTPIREILPVWAHYCGQVQKAHLGEFRTQIVRWMESWQESREET
jgi:hypothetical protein